MTLFAPHRFLTTAALVMFFCLASSSAMAEPATVKPASFCFTDNRYCGLNLSFTMGTGFAPGGIGPRLGYEIGRFTPFVEYGLYSKANRLGHPLVVGLRAAVSDALYLTGALSQYHGSGVRPILFNGVPEGDDPEVNYVVCAAAAMCPYGIVRNVNTQWNLVYAHLGAGYVPWQTERTRLSFEVGLAYNVYSRLKISAADKSTYGNPRRVMFAKDMTAGTANFGAGKGDFGAYLALALEFSPKSQL